MYGLINKNHLTASINAVVKCLGGSSDVSRLLLETAGAETNRGQAKDNTKDAGMGITQIDYEPFKDILNRCRQEDKDKIYECFNINIDWVKWEELRYNVLLSIIFTRLKYKKIPEIVPDTIEKRAKYWKKYYNTEAGKGTIEHYMKANSGS